MSLVFKRFLIAVGCLVLLSPSVGILLFREPIYSMARSKGVSVQLHRASLMRSIHGASCTISFCPEFGNTVRVKLYQDPFNGPVSVIPTLKSNLFLCVYDHDFDWQLIRIDLSKPFEPDSATGPIRSRVLDATCRIERVQKEETNDWNFAADYIERLSPSDFRRQVVPAKVLRPGQKMFVTSLRNFGDQATYPGE